MYPSEPQGFRCDLERILGLKVSYNAYKSYTQLPYITYKYDKLLSYIPYKYG